MYRKEVKIYICAVPIIFISNTPENLITKSIPSNIK